MTDTLKATLQHDLHAAMRAREEVRVATLRMTLTAISNEEVSGTTARELSDEETLKVVAKEAKKRKESATAYRDAGRPELAERIVAAGGRQRMPVREYYPGEKPYRMVYVEDPFGIVFELYSHSYELTYSAGAYA